MRRHVIEESYYVGGARFPPSTDWMYSAKTSDAVWMYSAKTSDAVCVCVIHVDRTTNASYQIYLLLDGSAGPCSWSEHRSGRRGFTFAFS